MERFIYQELSVWKHSPRRKPLILNGARQVGKTHALRSFASRHYQNYLYLNFEQDDALCAYFHEDLDPIRLLNLLSLHTGQSVEPGQSLIIFDEVQACPRALNSLKYFCEQANQYHLAAAGSLLGVKMAHQAGFPVGKVNFLNLYPLSFSEFLCAMGQKRLHQYLMAQTAAMPLPEPLHEKLIGLLKEYLYVGGMPEAVQLYVETQDYRAVRAVQLEILSAYERDFAKHAPADQIMKIQTVWQQAPIQIVKENKKFIFSAIRKSARGRDYEEAITWLIDAGLLLKSTHLNTPKLPLQAYANPNYFKLFLFDIGLLGAQVKLSAKTIIKGHSLFTEFKGALTENYVAQTLSATNRPDLYYWTSSGTAEIDFILQHEDYIIPLEVKAGTSNKKKSLLSYDTKYQPDIIMRSGLLNLKKDKHLITCPLYLLPYSAEFLEYLF